MHDVVFITHIAEELQSVTDYIMEDKFVILEPPPTSGIDTAPPTNSTSGTDTDVTTTRNRRFRDVHVNSVSRPHPIETMVSVVCLSV